MFLCCTVDVDVYLLLQEADFYMYSLYSKNKPKSDDIMAECGSAYFAVSVCIINLFSILWTICTLVVESSHDENVLHVKAIMRLAAA